MIDKTNLRIETVNEYCIVNEKNQIVKDGFYSEEEAAEWLEEVYGVKHEPKPQPKIGGWIPCSERLPEEYGDYLVTYGFSDVEVKVVDVSSYSENGFEFINVIAWQPLPEEYHG